ncbi:hypothetical protein [Acaryochloris sp. IP29b_bin.148]|uniref:hypothetical protein n=1 Tax=Acaryochloris sp. IP29b_bin.148 TaxID=2969218 RepID=UPI002614B49B|nr:hypothetical protein [Acaryochloris sp. IP29b_bin.148]
MQFSAYYKLGLSLGYKYYHTPFVSTRSSKSIDSSFLENILGKIDKIASKIPPLRERYSWMRRAYDFDVYDFLGFNQGFNSDDIFSLKKELQVIDVVIGDDTLLLNDIDSFGKLQKYIIDYIESKIKLDFQNVLVEFKLEGKRYKLFALIHSTIHDFQDSLSLREIFCRKSKKPYEGSLFLDKKLKILLHVRQGDTTVIKTPWQTYIPMHSLKKMKEYKEVEDIEHIDTKNIFYPPDYLNFIKGLISYFDDDAYSILTFSDGYHRAFMRLEKNIDTFNFNHAQIKSLKKIKSIYTKVHFKEIQNVNNNKCFIGESSKHLSQLIRSTLDADIVITSSQQRMLPKLIESYRDSESKSIVIILYKDRKPDYKDITSMSDSQFIYTDLYRPNYEYIFQRLMYLNLMNPNRKIKELTSVS